MQNKSALWIFSILLALACLYQLSFSVFTSNMEGKARAVAIAQRDSVLAEDGNQGLDEDSILVRYESVYLRDHRNDQIYPILGFTYGECKEKEINLGLDLKGGMAVTLEVSIPEMIANLSDNSQNPTFRQAIESARELQKTSDQPYIQLFASEFQRIDPNASLAAIFHARDKKELFPREATNDQIITILEGEAATAVENTERILRNRIDKFGVAQPSIQKQLGGRILIELPGVKDKERVRKVLQSTANLEFWETYDNAEVYPLLEEANTRLAVKMGVAKKDTAASAADALLKDDGLSSADQLVSDAAEDPVDEAANEQVEDSAEVIDPLAAQTKSDSDSAAVDTSSISEQRSEFAKENPLFAMITPAVGRDASGQFRLSKGAVVGYANITDTAEANRLIKLPSISNSLPGDLKLMWGAKAFDETALPLYAIKVPRGGEPKLDGSVITDARQDFNMTGEVEVAMQMNAEGAQIWKVMTGDNIGKSVAIVLDGMVYSAPVVQSEIAGGRSSISMGTGDVAAQIQEAEDLANILKAGALPAPARIIDETVVGPSLGRENVSQGLYSFLFALLMVLVYMVLYYSRAGFIADIALAANLLFLIGSLASLQASLTLPGIAGIVLTIGMAVDANVLIFERIREELRAGKMIKSAVEYGYSIKGAMSAIIDANITTLATAAILYFFGSGPIRGFATTLGIGILTSLFSAIFISRLLIYRRLEKKKEISFWTPLTKNILADPKIDFIGIRKYYYILSAILIGVGIYSMVTRGFNLGVDFSGGRSYVVRFDQEVNVDGLKADLAVKFTTAERRYTSNVKTYGISRQVKVTTNFLVENTTPEADDLVESALRAGLDATGVSYSIQESRKVDATISDDIQKNAILAISFALIFIFLYIVFRFRRWQFGLGALFSLIHDVLVVLGIYSFLHGRLPFSLEIDEAFIAAILTVVGYSINDTVVVFDRIREYLRDHKRDNQATVVNNAMNATLSRTLNTSFTTMLVLLVVFLFGGVSIQGFVFALLIGILVGTYSSIFIASAAVVDMSKDIDPDSR